MKLQIHGAAVLYKDGPCGIYKYDGPMVSWALLDPNVLAGALNKFSRDEALPHLTALRTRAAEQRRLDHTPQNQGYPILRQTGSLPPPIDEVREQIGNTVNLCDAILEA